MRAFIPRQTGQVDPVRAVAANRSGQGAQAPEVIDMSDALPQTRLASEPSRYEEAKRRAEELQGLYIHMSVYAVINVGLFVIDLLTGGGWWFYWPLATWGLALLIHVMTVLVPVFSPTWVERRARRGMDSDL